ncbi:MAG: tetratricopeptide repeat protein [Chloroflexota bacterium]|nr:tetratricopeptide repeat protein [Chloroflexota bacterium]
MNRKPDRRLLITFPVLALLAVGLILILRPTAMTYLDLLRQGDEHAARAERTAAVAAYQEATSLRPNDPVPHLRLAQVHLEWGRTDDALSAIAEAERLGTEKATSEQLRVAIHTARADWPTVVEHAQQLLALASAGDADEPATTPGDADTARQALAHAYVELQEWDAAQAEYQALLRADPTNSVAHERLGALLLGDDPVAIQHLLSARTALADRLLVSFGEANAVDDPAYASALLGLTLFEAQEWVLAARQFERALSYNPDYPDAHAYLGCVLDQMGQPDEAWPHLHQAITLAPASPVAHIFLGLHYDRQGDFSSARAAYETAYDLDSTNPATCVEIGQTWAAEGRYVAAEVWLREAVSLQPGDPALWEVLARFYLDHNVATEEQGIEATAKLVQLLPDDAHAHTLRGWAAFQVGDYDTAESSLLRAISLDPMLALAHYHLGRLRAAQGAHQEAQEPLIRALDLDTTGELGPLVERAMEEIP